MVPCGKRDWQHYFDTACIQPKLKPTKAAEWSQNNLLSMSPLEMLEALQGPVPSLRMAPDGDNAEEPVAIPLHRCNGVTNFPKELTLHS